MTTMVDVVCEGCGHLSSRPLGEVNRSKRLGRRVFCGLKCSGRVVNREKRSKEFVMACPWCAKPFKTTTHNKAKKHCSPSCASKGSMSPARREAQRQAGLRHAKNLSVAAAMKIREAWKYELLRPMLENEDHEFECEIGGFVFDLVLYARKIAVEFDGPEHGIGKRAVTDEEKDRAAEAAGFIVVRRAVLPATVISPETMAGLL